MQTAADMIRECKQTLDRMIEEKRELIHRYMAEIEQAEAAKVGLDEAVARLGG